MKSSICSSLLMVLHALIYTGVIGQLTPEDIELTRKGVQRMIFDEHQSIIISKLEPNKIIEPDLYLFISFATIFAVQT